MWWAKKNQSANCKRRPRPNGYPEGKLGENIHRMHGDENAQERKIRLRFFTKLGSSGGPRDRNMRRPIKCPADLAPLQNVINASEQVHVAPIRVRQDPF